MNINYIQNSIKNTYSTKNLSTIPNLYDFKTFLDLEYPEIFLKKYKHLLQFAFPVHYPYKDIKIKNKCILDIGCGIALDCAIAIELNAYKVFGIELSHSLLKKGFSHKNFIKILGNYINNPFKDGIFDIIVFNGSFNLFLDKFLLMQECYNNLKENGIIILLDLLWIHDEKEREIYKNPDFWDWNIGGSLTEYELLEIFKKNNFKIIKIKTLELIEPLKRAKIILQKS